MSEVRRCAQPGCPHLGRWVWCPAHRPSTTERMPSRHDLEESALTTFICGHCDGWITASNRRWPGFCSPFCRDTHRQQREQLDAARRRRRAVSDYYDGDLR